MGVKLGFELEHQLSGMQSLVLAHGWAAAVCQKDRMVEVPYVWRGLDWAGLALKRVKHSLWKWRRLHTPKTLVPELCTAGSDERDTLGGDSAELLVTVWEQGIGTGHHPL